MRDEEPKDVHAKRLEEAAEWFVRLQAPNADSAAWVTFTLWLEADPANRIAYEAIENADMDVGRLALPESDILTAPAQFVRPAPAPKKVAPWIVAATMATAAAVLLVMLRAQPDATKEYGTRPGETKSIVLSDASRIELNTNSTIRIVAGSRTVFLDRGEAYFRIVKSRTEPFTVHVGDRIVRDIGTSFDIVYADKTTTVTVVEGLVDVRPAQASSNSRSKVLVVGDQLVHVDGTSRSTVTRVDPVIAVSWRQGYLIYKDAPLFRVVSDLNRYFATKIILADSDVADQRFSGVLKIDDEDAVLRRICGFLPVTMERDRRNKITLRMSSGHR